LSSSPKWGVNFGRRSPPLGGQSSTPNNIPHLWLVDPIDRTLEAFELHDGQWLLIASATDDEPVSIRPFDAITFNLGDLWP